ncbi:MAG: sigma-70 family RNA polymerase sigma factor, partial [Isosphaerales bacterium]
MTIRRDGAVLRHLNTLFNIGVTGELTDGQLLERFSTGPSEVAELAFEALIDRHGAMVLRVCRAQLADPDDTHDAFQATFLILVKKARSLWVRDSLGPWLHQVAFRTASCARSAAARRRKHERRAAEMASTLDAHENRLAPDWENILHEEINRLPECYRVPIVLCDLQGCTCEEVARRMGRPVGSVKSWRSRGRERLRDRLIRRGLAPSAALGTALAQDIARATVPEETIRLAVRALSDGMTAGKVSASVHTLIKGVLKTMLLSKLQTTATAVFALVFLTAGLGTLGWVVADDSHRPVDQAQPKPPRPAFADQPQRTSGPSKELGETWPLTLREAIHIGLDNADGIRFISIGTPSKIAPIKTAVDPQQFKADTMARVRSIEQQYWYLAQAHAQIEGNKKSVELAEEFFKRETAELAAGRGTSADVAESSARLEQFTLELATRTSDVISTERLLRKLLGLPSADGRKIVPATAPVEAQLEPDWDISLAAMLENQPEIIQAKARVKQAEARKAGTVASRLAQLKSQNDSL